MTTTAIKFYSSADEYGDFSNFAGYPILLDGEVWPTVEHYFQAQKFKDLALRKKIRGLNSPSQAAKMGRDRKNKLRDDWESVKIDVMRKAVMAKFTQHSDLRELLCSTGTVTLVEHTVNDTFWADGGDGSGKNWLGKILMEVRATFQAA